MDVHKAADQVIHRPLELLSGRVENGKRDACVRKRHAVIGGAIARGIASMSKNRTSRYGRAR